MKLVSYLLEDEDRLGIYVDGKVYDTLSLNEELVDNMQDLLWEGEDGMEVLKAYDAKIKSGDIDASIGVDINDLILLSPVPHPTSTRDAYAFRQHVAAARRNRGVEMIPEFDQFPIFYFTNHNSTYGPGDIDLMKDHMNKLDFELEIAIVVGKPGINIPVEEADGYIAGFMVYNDMSARVMQMEEMKLNLGPAKGKDFANAFGPFFVTPDELASKLVPAKEGHHGRNYDLSMKCWVNGKQVSEGNVKDMDWTFAEILERVSYGTEIFPGDVIGSGTVGTGCFLELNGTGLRLDESYTPQWLKDGDVVDMEIDGLGKLSNTMRLVDHEYSVLAKKKQLSVVK